MKKINPNLEKLAEITHSQELIERERKLAEEMERKRQEDAIYHQKLAELHKEKSETREQESMRDLESAFTAFVEHPDFPRIYNQLQTIHTITDRWGFIMRRAYEIGHETNLLIGYLLQNNSVPAKRKFEDYGIYLLCPYFNENKEQLVGQECLIDGEPIASSCNGEHEQCVVFNDRARKADSGFIQLPVIKRNQPKIQVPKMEVDPVDLNDLEDWWQMEGKYE